MTVMVSALKTEIQTTNLPAAHHQTFWDLQPSCCSTSMV
ncbi:hypothetical protein SynPROSU1_02620 [Synechococcus sp. PROS-U-1]|nr:hypothetical protein SynPROSU1_02620 [Synechococcus sp. PROS-U-1]